MTEPTEPNAGANSAQSHSEAANETENDITTQVERMASDGKVRCQERVTALRTKLAHAEEELRRWNIILETLRGKVTASRATRAVAKAAGGKVVDPIKSARALAAWKTKRRKAEAVKAAKEKS